MNSRNYVSLTMESLASITALGTQWTFYTNEYNIRMQENINVYFLVCPFDSNFSWNFSHVECAYVVKCKYRWSVSKVHIRAYGKHIIWFTILQLSMQMDRQPLKKQKMSTSMILLFCSGFHQVNRQFLFGSSSDSIWI